MIPEHVIRKIRNLHERERWRAVIFADPAYLDDFREAVQVGHSNLGTASSYELNHGHAGTTERVTFLGVEVVPADGVDPPRVVMRHGPSEDWRLSGTRLASRGSDGTAGEPRAGGASAPRWRRRETPSRSRSTCP